MTIDGGAEVRPELPGATAESFTTWVRPHWDVMVRLAQRLCGDGATEDVVQEALAAAWRSRHRFDPDRGSARSWLLATVANKARNVRSSRDRILVDVGVDESTADSDPAASLDVASALHRLTDRQRTAVALHYYLGLSTGECAEVMDCSAGTVKSTLSDARGRLRTLLGEDYR